MQIKSSIFKLDNTHKAEIRTEVANILIRAKPLQDNMLKKERQVLAKLKKDEDIIILEAGKGNTTVIMDRSEYNENLVNVLSDETTYRLLLKDPMKSHQAKTWG